MALQDQAKTDLLVDMPLLFAVADESGNVAFMSDALASRLRDLGGMATLPARLKKELQAKWPSAPRVFRLDEAHATVRLTPYDDGTRCLVLVSENALIRDELTGLPRRDMLQLLLEERQHMKQDACLLICDLDRFKAVNDAFGHETADRLMKAVVGRMEHCLAEGDALVRLNGDEFAVLPQDADPQAGFELAEKLINIVQRPFLVDGHVLQTGMSIGVAASQDSQNSHLSLLQLADLALHKAKLAGRARACRFEPRFETEMHRSAMLQNDLAGAIALNDLHIVYQPKVKVDGVIDGAEALLRWTHPVHGVVSPIEFIPLAEKSGLIHKLGLWVMEQACATAVNWPNPIPVSVNVSPRQFLNQGFVRQVASVLERTGLPPHRLIIEITEGVLFENSERNLASLRELKEIGVAISLDDFGTGFSSLQYLKAFTFDSVKIDASFVRDMMHSREDDAVIRAVISIGKRLDIRIVAEGVETQAQADALRAYGVDEFQGYLFGRPMPEPELVSKWLH